METLHDSEQRYYKATEEAMGDINYATFGSSYISLSWGGIYTSTLYVVGPGSSLELCEENRKQECKHREQAYSVAEDRRIAELNSRQLLDVLAVDPDYQNGVPQSTIDAYRNQGNAEGSATRYDEIGLSDYCPKVLATQAGERMLWQAIKRHHNHPENSTDGVVMRDILCRAEKLGVDRGTALRALGGELVEDVIIKPWL